MSMRRRIAVRFLLSVLLTLRACGASSGPVDPSDSLAPDADTRASSSGGAVIDEAGAVVDVDAGSSAPDASPDDAGGSSSVDGAPSADAAVGDGGLQAYKGVANSACADLVRLGVTWWYNWTLSPSGCTASQFVPMIWVVPHSKPRRAWPGRSAAS